MKNETRSELPAIEGTPLCDQHKNETTKDRSLNVTYGLGANDDVSASKAPGYVDQTAFIWTGILQEHFLTR